MDKYYVLYKKTESENFRIFGGYDVPNDMNTYNNFKNAYHAIRELRNMGYFAKLRKATI